MLQQKDITKQINWLQIKTDYIFGKWKYLSNGKRRLYFPPIAELAELYDVSINTIKSKASGDSPSWVVLRNQYATKMEVQILEEEINISRSVSAQNDAENLAHINTINFLLEQRLQDLVNETQCIDENGRTGKIDTKELLDVMNILDKKHTLVRKIFGEPITEDKLHASVREEEKNAILGKDRDKMLTQVKKMTNEIEKRKERLEKLRLREKSIQEQIEQ